MWHAGCVWWIARENEMPSRVATRCGIALAVLLAANDATRTARAEVRRRRERWIERLNATRTQEERAARCCRVGTWRGTATRSRDRAFHDRNTHTTGGQRD